jgi:hypothetical protein
MAEMSVAPLDRRYPFVTSAAQSGGNMEEEKVTYLLLAEAPDKIENWIKKFARIEPNVTRVLSLANVNDEYVEKSVVWKWPPVLELLAIEMVEGRGRVSFEHVIKARTEIGLTFFGNVMIAKMVSITDVAGAKQTHPILMKRTAELELNDFIPLDDAYTQDEVIVGYESNKLENLHLQHILEEEMERMLDDNGFAFSEDRKTYTMFCNECECTPCVWAFNKKVMIDYAKATHDENTAQSTRHHAMYRQLALYINGGPTGRGNRLKLPTCVLTGVPTFSLTQMQNTRVILKWSE